MRISIKNNAQLPKKYLRFVKWKFFNFKEKFDQLIYADVFLNSEGQSPKTYIANIRLGIAGKDIIIQNKSRELGKVSKKSFDAVHRYLAKNKNIQAERMINY